MGKPKVTSLHKTLCKYRKVNVLHEEDFRENFTFFMYISCVFCKGVMKVSDKETYKMFLVLCKSKCFFIDTMCKGFFSLWVK